MIWRPCAKQNNKNLLTRTIFNCFPTSKIDNLKKTQSFANNWQDSGRGFGKKTNVTNSGYQESPNTPIQAALRD